MNGTSQYLLVNSADLHCDQVASTLLSSDPAGKSLKTMIRHPCMNGRLNIYSCKIPFLELLKKTRYRRESSFIISFSHFASGGPESPEEIH